MDLAALLSWWFFTGLYGVTGLALSRLFLRHLPDKGWCAARPLGLFAGSWLPWILASLGLASYSTTLVLLCLTVWLAGGIALLALDRERLLAEWPKVRNPVILCEVLFLFGLLAMGWMRSYMPDIGGTEKFPDFAFMSALVRETSLPPEDPWFAGKPINYFYFGHYLMANLVRLTGVATGVGFNCAIALIYAFVLAGAGAIGYNLTRKVRGALLAPLFLAVMGNLFIVYQVYTNWYVLPKAAIQYNQPDKAAWSETDWWWHPSRVVVKAVPDSPNTALPGQPGGPPAISPLMGGIHRHIIEKFRIPGWKTVDETINEFPFWSFLLGDMHAHLMVVMLTLLNLYLLLGVATAPGVGLALFGEPWRLAVALPVLAVTVGAVPATNYWDLPQTALMTLTALAIAHLRAAKFETLLPRLASAAGLAGALFVTAWLTFLPFSLHFVPQTKESPVGWVDAEKLTSFIHFFYMFGFFLVMVLAYLVPRVLDTLSYEELPLPLVFGLPLGVAFAAGLIRGSFLFGFLVLVIVLLAYVALRVKRPPAELFAVACVTLAFCMIAGCEVIVIKDFYSNNLLRMNTLFKFYHQAWNLLSLGCAYLAWRCFTDLFAAFRKWPVKQVYFGVFGVFLLVSLGFTYNGPMKKSRGFQRTDELPRFDGIAYMARWQPDDHAAIIWLNENVKQGRPRILEATGGAFSHYSRISAATGLPTILGWGNHEALWRDNDWKTITPRTNEVRQAYTSVDRNEVEGILRKYEIKYVFIGHLEKKDYAGAGLDKFGQWRDRFRLMQDAKNGQLYEVTW